MSKIYVRVIDGEVVERSTRPRVENISSAHLLSDADLARHGWLPLEREEPDREGRVVRYETTIERDRVVETPVVKVDERPETQPWEKVVKGDEVDRGDWVEVPYTIETTPLEEFKERKKSQLISAFSMEAGEAYSQTIQLLVLFGALDNNTTKEVEDYYKREGKKLEDALKLVDGADTHEAVEAVEVA